MQQIRKAKLQSQGNIWSDIILKEEDILRYIYHGCAFRYLTKWLNISRIHVAHKESLNEKINNKKSHKTLNYTPGTQR